jgi:hydroxymethylpyrimidine pyrophosphatase-like HAD family hydrolase
VQVAWIWCDFDGTITPDYQPINDPEVASIFGECIERGVEIGGVTGRNLKWVIGHEGGITNPDLLDRFSMIITGGGSTRIAPPWTDPHGLGPHHSRTIKWFMRHYYGIPFVRHHFDVPKNEIWTDWASISTWRTYEHQTKRAVERVDQWRGRVHLRRLNLKAIYNDNSVLYLPDGLNKQSAVAAEMASRGIDMSQVVACGDGENDLPLLASAGLALVPADADPKLLALPNAVIASQPGPEGVKALLRDLLAGRIKGWSVGGIEGLAAAS